RHNSGKRPEFVSAFEHCDMVAATLCGITDAKQVKRSICAMGHKWMWNASLGGLPPENFLVKVDPLFAGVREKINGEFAASNQLAGRLSPHWAQQLGLKPGIPIPVGAFDAHWDAKISRRSNRRTAHYLDQRGPHASGKSNLTWNCLQMETADQREVRSVRRYRRH